MARDQRVVLWVNGAEKGWVEAAAARAGMPVGTWVRWVVMAQLPMDQSGRESGAGESTVVQGPAEQAPEAVALVQEPVGDVSQPDPQTDHASIDSMIASVQKKHRGNSVSAPRVETGQKLSAVDGI